MSADSSPPFSSQRVSGPVDQRPVVLVTGSAKRLGRSIALHLAQLGWRVAIHARASLAEAQDTSAQAAQLCMASFDATQRPALEHLSAYFMADLSQEAPCLALVNHVITRMGRIDAVVNNASMFEWDDGHSLKQDLFEAHWRTNTLAPLQLTQALHRYWQDPSLKHNTVWPCAIHILDQKLHNPNPDHLSYTLSKAALKEAVRLQAMALAPQVRVVGISPGITLTSGPMTQGEFTSAHSMTPLGRSSTAQDIAQAVAYALHSPALTGCDLLVDGGQHLMGQRRDVLFLAQNAGV